MKRKLTYIALAGTLVLGAATTASALEIQQNLRNQDTNTQTTTQQQRDAANAVRNRVAGRTGRRTATTVRTEAGETAPFVFGSTTTVDRPGARQTATNARASERRTLNVQIRNVQRQYMNLRRAGDPRAESVRLELERLKAQQQQLNRGARAQQTR